MHTHTPTLWNRICFNLPSLKAKVFALFRKARPLRVLSSEETLERVLHERLSVARFGDGEWRIQRGGSVGFQGADPALAKRLTALARHPSPRCLNCLPNIFDSLDGFTPAAASTWRRILRLQRAWIAQTFGGEYLYGDALISRFYIDTQDRTRANALVCAWQRLWQGREVLIVEGKHSRMGVGSDLFEGATTLQRILCPAVDAWNAYDAIREAVRRHGRDKLILLALGPTATLLAHDLSEDGYWAVDCGHLEVEYQWMLMGATEKVPIPNRWVNEADGLHTTEPCTSPLETLYRSQIVEQILP